ncbi:conserved Plasmodium protein, unknown function [Plasmodium sp. DRC-Itaito]|nr:conserved Plasmodium protein, unknown function [Plasmodium sp. DRC-Itaito]
MGLYKNNNANFFYGKKYRQISRELERINNIILKYNKNIKKCIKNKKKCLDELYILASYENFLKKKYETYQCKLEGYINEEKDKMKINEVIKGRNKKYYNSPNNNKIFSYNANLINDDNLFKKKKNKKIKNKMITMMINKGNDKDKNLHKNEMKGVDHVFLYNNNNNKKKNITSMVSSLGYGYIKRKCVTNKYIKIEQDNNKMDENKNRNIHSVKNDEIRKHSTIQPLYHSNNKEKIITKNVVKDESANIIKAYDINKYDNNIIEYKQEHREKEKNKSMENMNICDIIYEKEQSHNICNILEENKEEEKYKPPPNDVIIDCNNNNVKGEEYDNEKEIKNVPIINDKNIEKNAAKKKKKHKKKNKKNKKNKQNKEKNNDDVLKHLENNVQDLELLYEEKIINVNTKKDEELNVKNKYSDKDIVNDILSEYSNTLQYTSFLDYMKDKMD